HWRDVLDKFLQAGRALASAHANNLVHRDFKPDNVLVGNDDRVRVMDFGLARSLFADPALDSTIEEPPTVADGRRPRGKLGQQPSQRPLDRPLTATGTVLGTPRYMAPEQFGGLVADARCDQFSFCVTMYEALYGHHPFKDQTSEGLIKEPDSTSVRPPPGNSDVPKWLHRAIMRGLELEPNKRFPSMDALLQEIAPRPLPEPRFRVVVPLAVAAVALSLAIVFMVRDIGKGEEINTANDTIANLERKTSDLNKQVTALSQELQVLTAELNQSSPDEVRKLREELTVAQEDLRVALANLEKTEQQLVELAEQRDTPPPPLQPRTLGIRPSEVRREIERYRTDFEVCFSEWRERTRQERSLYAVRITIRGSGLPEANIISAGIDDDIVRSCVGGLINRMRFREIPDMTIVEVGFRYEDGVLSSEIRVADVRPDRG
ncbi:MAG: protein kinase, partial [Myxococcota bacterium]